MSVLAVLFAVLVVSVAVAIAVAICVSNRRESQRQELVDEAVAWRSDLGQAIGNLKEKSRILKEEDLCVGGLPSHVIADAYKVLGDIDRYLRGADAEMLKLDAWIKKFRSQESIVSMREELDDCKSSYSTHFDDVSIALDDIAVARKEIDAQKRNYSTGAVKKRFENARTHAYTLMSLITECGQAWYLSEELGNQRASLLEDLSTVTEEADDSAAWGHIMVDHFERRVGWLNERSYKFVEAGVGKTYPRLPWLQGLELDVPRQSSRQARLALVGVN